MSNLEVLWRRDLHLCPHRVASDARNGVLLTLERHSRLVRLDPHTGALLWEMKVEDPWGTLELRRGVCTYLSQAGTLRQVDVETGVVRWSALGGRLLGYVCDTGTAVLGGGWRGYRPLQAFDRDTGRQLWTAGPEHSTAEKTLWPLSVPGGALVTARGSRDLWLLDPASGARHAHWHLPEPVTAGDHEAALIPTTDGRIVFRTGASSVAVLDGDEVNVLWRHQHELSERPPRILGRYLWLTHRTGFIVIDVVSGVSRDVKMTEGPAAASVPAGGGVVTADRSGLLTFFSPDGTEWDRSLASRRYRGLTSGAEGMVHVLGKGEIIGVRVVSPPPIDQVDG